MDSQLSRGNSLFQSTYILNSNTNSRFLSIKIRRKPILIDSPFFIKAFPERIRGIDYDRIYSRITDDSLFGTGRLDHNGFDFLGRELLSKLYILFPINKFYEQTPV
ncbi:hypothetical protein IQ66_17930 [Leptospira borgpetersenii serovar Ballum]|nr:hypothetical protein IQ66_17930 [Leptospira borgpetersenii serovar Ballum]